MRHGATNATSVAKSRQAAKTFLSIWSSCRPARHKSSFRARVPSRVGAGKLTVRPLERTKGPDLGEIGALRAWLSVGYFVGKSARASEVEEMCFAPAPSSAAFARLV